MPRKLKKHALFIPPKKCTDRVEFYCEFEKAKMLSKLEFTSSQKPGLEASRMAYHMAERKNPYAWETSW